jgi:hypothetical protein
MIHDDQRFTIYDYHLYYGDYKNHKDLYGLYGVPIDDSNFEKILEYAMKIKVFFDEHKRTDYTIYRKKNNHGQYFWRAEKRVNCKLRTCYIGYRLPDRAKLTEISELFFLSDIEYYKLKRSLKDKGVKSSTI